MAVNEWKIWKQIGIVKPKKEYVDIDKTMDVLLDFLNEQGPALKRIGKLYNQFKTLRNMELKLKKEKAKRHALKENIQKQIKKYDQIIKAYEILELDTDVNGERVKKIANEIQKRAKKLGADKEMLSKITKSDHWNFDW